jgi:5-methyltetrahydrofolate--homocysteine methyltransferase
MGLREQTLLVFDGATGTGLQRMGLPASAWDRFEGCNEYLNLSAPDALVELHRSFLDAGCTAIETNTFGANALVLAEYDLADRVEAINRAGVENARKAIGDRTGRFVVGSIGPGTRLPFLGHVSIDALGSAYAAQMRVLVEAGVDGLILETCQDPLQVRTGIHAALDVMEALGRDLPLLVSITLEAAGTMLVGTDPAAAAAMLEPYPLLSLGFNCATGPERMAPHVRRLSRLWPGRLSVMPNAGLPEVVDGRTVYPLSPESFAEQVARFVEEDGVSIVGGCCGTTPEHLRRLVARLEGRRPAAREVVPPPALSSAYVAVELRQDPPPLLIGERANATGSKAFRDKLLADDLSGALAVGLAQESQGAHAIDLSVAYAGRDEIADMRSLARAFAESAKLPLVIDSTRPDAIEAALRAQPGRSLINSVNLEDGGANLDRVCRLAKRYGAAVIALTIDEAGMALTADRKVAVARRIRDRAVGVHGLRPCDLLFDALTFTIGSGDEKFRGAAVETLAAVRRIKAELPGCGTVLGVSNVSFGLARQSRRVLNSVFLHEATAAGLDAAIIDAGKILPLASLGEADRAVSLDLIHDRIRDPARTPLAAFLDHFAAAAEAERGRASGEDPERPVEQALAARVAAGNADGVEDLLDILLARRRPTAIVNEVLVPAMRHVGELFGRGEMLLPFVLQSAEVMKRCVTLLEPHMERTDEPGGLKVLLATVRGDVHDIGKNLVDILFTNNGHRVVNLGIKVPAEEIVAKAKEHGADAIGLSGLLVKSAMAMKDDLPLFRSAGLDVPILLGGAALTPRFVAESCVPGYGGPVVYCADAFAGLRTLAAIEDGTVTSTSWTGTESAPRPGSRSIEIRRDVPVPEPPFLGRRHVHDIDPATLWPHLNEQALFRGRWGYRRGKLSLAEHDALLRDEVRPRYEELKRRVLAEGLARPKVAYGWFRAWSEGNDLRVEHDGRRRRFPFPRQADPPHLCIADFFRDEAEGGDLAGFFVVTLGPGIARAARESYEADRYRDYLLLHGLGVELTDALAEYQHGAMRREIGIDAPVAGDGRRRGVREHRGTRYGFGYPACPDLDAHGALFELLDPAAIGVALTESFEMVPEMTTSALVAHHPQARYFAV